MSDYYDESGIHSPEGYGETEKKRRLDPVAVFGASALLLIVFSLLGAKLFLGGGSDRTGPRDGISEPPTARSPSPATSNPLEPKQLKGLANSIAQRLDVGDTEVAYSITLNAETITNCDITAYTGGAGGADLAEKPNRDVVRKDAGEKGIPIAFGHSGKTWIVVAQVCE